jgi:single-strand DNA-binding protein
MNNWVGVGRATKDVETRYSQGDNPMAVSKVTMAIDSGYGDKKKTNFVPIVAFGKTAEAMEKYLVKGKLFAVQGEYTTGSYKNKEGVTVYTTQITANKVQILEWGDKQDTQEGAQDPGVPEGFSALDSDEIPF